MRLEADEDELCRRLAAREPDGFWLRVLEEMGAAELELRQPVDARLQVEACLLRLCRGGSAAAGEERLAQLEARMDGLEGQLGSAARDRRRAGLRRTGGLAAPGRRLPPIHTRGATGDPSRRPARQRAPTPI